jgi:hypothetical protein
MTVLNGSLGGLQCQSGSSEEERNFVSLPGSKYDRVVFGSAARSLVTMPTETFRLRIAMSMKVANVYIEDLQLKRRYEILIDVLKKIQEFLEPNCRNVNSQ